MKIRKLLLPVLILGLAFSACKKDDFTLFLNYDDNNFTSPTLPAGTYELAARFPAAETSDYTGSLLKVVDAYIVAEPQAVRLKIYGQGNGNEPGDVLYSKSVTNEIRTDQWVRLEIDDPIEITGEELWISLRITLGNQQQSVGCDAGPGHPEGSYVFLDDSDVWTTYSAWVGESINWNIRGGVE